MLPIVALIGRANVGKSTFFNRLCQRHQALVDNRPGITRDRHYATITQGDRPFTLVDTGGFEFHGGELHDQVRRQAEEALREADVILFMVDGRQDLQADDEQVAKVLRQAGKPVLLAVNKIDGPKQEAGLTEFYRLGFDPLYPLSAAHGLGIGNLLDGLMEVLPQVEALPEASEAIPVAVLGRPNVGKSSLINLILGEERLVTSSLPGTTRDAIDTPVTWRERDYIFIDTAGIRRRSRIVEQVERGMVAQSSRALERAAVALLLLDAEEGLTEQDLKIAGEIYQAGKGCVVGVNKWDLVDAGAAATRLMDKITDGLQFMAFAPVTSLSVKTGKNLDRVFTLINQVFEQFSFRVTTAELNRIVSDIVAAHRPPRVYHRSVKFYYATQAAIQPPAFIFFTNFPAGIPAAYRRYLANQLRLRLELPHAPMKIHFKQRGS